MLDLLVTCLTLIGVSFVFFYLLPFMKIYKSVVFLFQIILCIILFPECEHFYYKLDVWKNPEYDLQQYHKTPYFPIKTIKINNNINDITKILEIEKSNGLYSTIRNDQYPKQCLYNYYINKTYECPITNIIIKKQKISTLIGYKEVEISQGLYIYYTKSEKLDGKLYRDISIKKIESINCDGDNEFIVDHNCINISLYSEFDYKNIEEVKKEKIKNPFKTFKNYTLYSDKICTLLLIFALIYCIFEPYNLKIWNLFKIINLTIEIITFILFLIRYIFFYQIKKYFFDNEIFFNKKDKTEYDLDYYYPSKYFNIDTFIFSFSIALFIYYIIYYYIPYKFHFKSNSFKNLLNEKYPLLIKKENKETKEVIDDGRKIKKIICVINIPFILVYYAIFIFDVLNDNKIKNNNKMINYNWESNSIKSIIIKNQNMDFYSGLYTWKNNIIFQFEKTKYNYYDNIKEEKESKICGKDYQGNNLNFPKDEECPINDIFITNEIITNSNYKKIELGYDNNYLYYTNKKTDGKILTNIKIGGNGMLQLDPDNNDSICKVINGNNYLKCNFEEKFNTILFYDEIDIWNYCDFYRNSAATCSNDGFPFLNLYSIYYLGIDQKYKDKIIDFKNNIKKFISLLKYKYIFCSLNILLYIIYYIIIYKCSDKRLIIPISVLFSLIILSNIIINMINLNLNSIYIQNFLNKINNDFKRNKCILLWNILLIIFEYYYFVFYLFYFAFEKFLIKKIIKLPKINRDKSNKENEKEIGNGTQSTERIYKKENK